MYRRNRKGGFASPWVAALLVGVVALGVGGAVASRNRARTQTPISYRAPLTPYSNVARGRTGVTPAPATTTPATGPGMSSSTSTGATGATGTGRNIGTTGTPGAGIGTPGYDGTPGTTGTTGAGAGAGTTGYDGTTGTTGTTGAGAGTTGAGAGTTGTTGAGVAGGTSSARTTTPSTHTPTPTAAPAGTATPPANVAGEGNMETQMLSLVNAERSRAGLPALSADPQLMKIARLKSQDMVNRNYFSHQSPTYGSPFDMLRTYGVTYRAAGENIALNQTTTAAHTALMNSSGHRANILGRQYTRVGIGIVRGSRGYYFTQTFTG